MPDIKIPQNSYDIVDRELNYKGHDIIITGSQYDYEHSTERIIEGYAKQDGDITASARKRRRKHGGLIGYIMSLITGEDRGRTGDELHFTTPAEEDVNNIIEDLKRQIDHRVKRKESIIPA